MLVLNKEHTEDTADGRAERYRTCNLLHDVHPSYFGPKCLVGKTIGYGKCRECDILAQYAEHDECYTHFTKRDEDEREDDTSDPTANVVRGNRFHKNI